MTKKILSFMVYTLILASMFIALMPIREAQASTPVLDRTDIMVIGDKNDAVAAPGYSGYPVIFRMDKDGNMIWQKELPFNKIAVGSQWIADRNLAEDSFYMIPGNVKFPENLIDGKTRLLKFDANGILLWDEIVGKVPKIKHFKTLL